MLHCSSSQVINLRGVVVLFKRTAVLLLIFTLTFSAVSCSRPPAPVEPAPGGEITDMASWFIASMETEAFDVAVSIFDPTMNQMLPESKLAQLWQDLLEQVGPFVGEVAKRVESEGEHDAVIVTAEFEKMMLDIRVVFDKNKKVAGMFFQPVHQLEGSYTQPPYVQPGSFTEREVTIGSGEWALPGTLTLPAAGGPHPVIVLVHGSGPNDRDETIGPNKPFKDLAWGLATRGIAVLRYEKRTLEHGQKMINQLETLTPKEEVTDDALAAVALLKNTGGIDGARIYVLGHSLGGTMVPRIGEHDSDIAGLVILAGTSRPFEDVILDQYEYLTALDGKITPEEEAQLEKIRVQVARVKDPALSPDTPAAEMPLGMPAPYWLYLRDYDPAQTAMSLAMPMLIIQGERDYQVTMEDFAGWQKVLSSRSDVEFKSYQSLNHLFIAGEGPGNPTEYMWAGNVAQEVVDDIADWLQSQ